MDEAKAQEAPAMKPNAEPAKVEAKAEDWKPPTREEWEKVTGALKATNAEAAARRLALAEAEAKAKADAEAKARAEGDWQGLLKAREEELSRLRAREAELAGYEGVVASEVSQLRERLGPRAAIADGLSPAQGLRVLRALAEATAGPGAAPAAPTTAPVPVQPTLDVSKMSKDELLAKFTPQQLAEMAAKLEGPKKRNPRGF